jgi:hypothetical protein
MTSTNANPVPMALALLDRWWPEVPALTDQPRPDDLSDLENNPRFLIGRLQQAITTLMSASLPPMDAQTELLSHAITDAIAWRLHQERPCPKLRRRTVRAMRCRLTPSRQLPRPGPRPGRHGRPHIHHPWLVRRTNDQRPSPPQPFVSVPSSSVSAGASQHGPAAMEPAGKRRDDELRPGGDLGEFLAAMEPAGSRRGDSHRRDDSDCRPTVAST